MTTLPLQSVVLTGGAHRARLAAWAVVVVEDAGFPGATLSVFLGIAVLPGLALFGTVLIVWYNNWGQVTIGGENLWLRE